MTATLRTRTWSRARPRPSEHFEYGESAWWTRVDLALIGSAAALGIIGVLMVYSATRGPEPPYHTTFLHKQALFVGAGLVLGAGAAAIDYRAYRHNAVGIYGLSLLALVAVVSPLGSTAKGAQSWFQVGSFQLQPSEPAKLALVVALAALAAEFRTGIFGRRLVALLATAALPIGLILLQPDLGTAMVFAAVLALVLVVAGTPLRLLAVLAMVGITLGYGALHSDTLAEYQRCRLTSFVDHTDAACEARGAGLNVEESQRAIGAGGATGQGLFEGNQTRLAFVPEQHTDFIFTAVGEQLGFAGSATVLALYGLLVWRILRIAQRSPDRFGTYLCAGVLGLLVFQIFENVGMSTGIMPVTGIPLPFLSYGGSATVVDLVAIGLVAGIGVRST